MPSDVHDARYMYIYLIVINLHSYVNGNYWKPIYQDQTIFSKITPY